MLATMVWFFSFSMNFILLAKSRYEKGMIFSEKYDFLEYIATFGPFGVSNDTTCMEQLHPCI